MVDADIDVNNVQYQYDEKELSHSAKTRWTAPCDSPIRPMPGPRMVIFPHQSRIGDKYGCQAEDTESEEHEVYNCFSEVY
jgi:hypothetical protein